MAQLWLSSTLYLYCIYLLVRTAVVLCVLLYTDICHLLAPQVLCCWIRSRASGWSTAPLASPLCDRRDSIIIPAAV